MTTAVSGALTVNGTFNSVLLELSPEPPTFPVAQNPKHIGIDAVLVYRGADPGKTMQRDSVPPKCSRALLLLTLKIFLGLS